MKRFNIRKFLATPFIVLTYALGLAFFLSCFITALIGGKSINDIDRAMTKIENKFKKGK